MNIVVDGIIFQLQEHGGISRIFSEILPRMCEIDKALHITLLLSGKSKQALPQHSRIHILSAPWYLRLPILKERWLRASVGETEDKIWHSTYFTLPMAQYRATVVTVADMVPEFFPDLFNAPGSKRFIKQKQRCILDADAVICISETTRKDVLGFYDVDPGKVWAIPLGYSDVFRQLPINGGNSPRVLAGLERVKLFSWQKTAEQTLGVLHSLTEEVE